MSEKWDLIIEPKRKVFDLQIRDVIRYRDLIILFVKRDFVTQYKQTILGPLWFIINPVISTIMYTFVFGNLANIGTNGIPYLLFYYSSTMLWNFFTGTFNDASNVFINNANLFGKVYFPRFTVPISNVFNNFMKLFVQFLMLLIFIAYYAIRYRNVDMSLLVFLFPLLLIWISAAGTGMGLIISSLTTKYRDLKQLVSFALHLAMYATPVVYPISEMPLGFNWINYINPISAPVELFRVWFYGVGNVSCALLLSNLAITTVLFLAGLLLFNQNERNFIDVV